MPKKILIPVNNLDCTYAALESIKARQWFDDPEFMLLNVVEDLNSFINSRERFHEEALAEEQRSYTREVVQWLKALKEDFCATFPNTIGHVDFGNVPSRIADVAFEWGADHIVMGSHDLELSIRTALGSVSASVVEIAPSTVEVLRYSKLRELMRSREEVTPERLIEMAKGPRRILIATDLSLAGSKAIDWAASIEWPPVSAIRLLTVAPPEHKEPGAHWFGPIGTVYTKEKRHQEVVQQELTTCTQQLTEKLRCVNIETELIIGQDASLEITERADEWHSDLIIMGARGKTASADIRAGNTVMKVLEKAHCSVVIVQHDTAQQVAYSWRRKAGVR